MTAEQILSEINALPQPESQKLFLSISRLHSSEVPPDFDEALDDFANGRFVSMDAALNETPPAE